jgi:hypothetical protein
MRDVRQLPRFSPKSSLIDAWLSPVHQGSMVLWRLKEVWT